MGNPVKVVKLIEERPSLEEKTRLDSLFPQHKREAELVPPAPIDDLLPPALHDLAHLRLVMKPEDDVVFRQAEVGWHPLAAIARHLPVNEGRRVFAPVDAVFGFPVDAGPARMAEGLQRTL